VIETIDPDVGRIRHLPKLKESKEEMAPRITRYAPGALPEGLRASAPPFVATADSCKEKAPAGYVAARVDPDDPEFLDFQLRDIQREMDFKYPLVPSAVPGAKPEVHPERVKMQEQCNALSKRIAAIRAVRVSMYASHKEASSSARA